MLHRWVVPALTAWVLTAQLAVGCHADALLDSGSGPADTIPNDADRPATELAFRVQPRTTVAGAPITPAVEVVALDHDGEIASDYGGSVTVSLDNHTASGTLVGTLTESAEAGIAVFRDLAVDVAAAGYRLVAKAGDLEAATSATFDITAGGGAAVRLVAGDDQTGTAGEPLGDLYTIRVTDVHGNAVPDVVVTWVVVGGGGSITPTRVTTDQNGEASARRTLGEVAGPQSATATAETAAAPVRFVATAVPGPAHLLRWTEEPGRTQAGAALRPAPEVTAEDRFGNLVDTFDGAVRMNIANNPGQGTLSGTTTGDAVGGVARFADLSIDGAGNGYQLRATSGDLIGATSAAFDIVAGPASALVVASGEAQRDTVAATLPRPYVVRVTDAFGNGVSGALVQWSASPNAGTVVPPTSETDGMGTASARHTLGTTAGIHRVTATAQGLSPVTFSATATAGNVAQLFYITQPSGGRAGAVITPAVVVRLWDQFGNAATGFNGPVTVEIAPLTGTPGATLSGTIARLPSNGAATFNDLSINLPGVAYRLRVRAGAVSADSDTFDMLLPE